MAARPTATGSPTSGPHPNPSKAASGARLHQLEPDPEAAPVVRRIFAMYLAGAGYKHIATVLTNEGVPCPSAHDPTRNSHRPGHAWAMSAVRAILTNPRYLGYHVSGRTKKADVLLDPDAPTLGHVTRQQWQDRDRVGHRLGADLRRHRRRGDLAPRPGAHCRQHPHNAVTPTRRRPMPGCAVPTIPLPARRPGDLRLLREDAPGQHGPRPGLLPLQAEQRLPGAGQRPPARAWPYARTACSPTSTPGWRSCSPRNASRPPRAESWRPMPKDTAKTRPSAVPGPRSSSASASIAKHLDGLEAGIPADVIASRIAAAQREKAAAEAVLATAPPAARTSRSRRSHRSPSGLAQTCPSCLPLSTKLTAPRSTKHWVLQSPTAVSRPLKKSS